MDEDCLGWTLMVAPRSAWFMALVSTKWARVVLRHATEVAWATERQVALGRQAAERGRVDVLERLQCPDESLVRTALAHHQWPALRWLAPRVPCERRVNDDLVGLYAAAIGCPVELPPAWIRHVDLERLPRRRTTHEEVVGFAQTRCPRDSVIIYLTAMCLPQAVAAEHGFDLPMIGGPATFVYSAADVLSTGPAGPADPADRSTVTVAFRRTVDVATDIAPLDPSYSVDLVDQVIFQSGPRITRYTGHVPIGVMAYPRLLFTFAGPPPATFGVSYDAWFLDNKTRARAVDSCRVGDMVIRYGCRHDLASADDVDWMRRRLLHTS